MINMIRADFYRLLRSRGFWISQILFVTFFSFLIFAKSAGNAGIMRQEAVSIDDKLVRTWTAANTMQAFSLMSSMVVFFLLASTMILIGTDLTHRTIKNQLTSGISRGTFFISKYLTFFILSFCQLIAFYGLAFVVGGLKNGWGDLT
ncbi:MAG: ABC transporter permease subunit, partial [Streptococcaceae bacterium]|nr:ABC transporter permease subunit [Streptococcaceae bacterium]